MRKQVILAPIVFLGLFFLPACVGQPPSGDRCPPEVEYDDQLQRCMTNSDDYDAGTDTGDTYDHDDGGGDTDPPPTNDTDASSDGDGSDPCDGVSCGGRASCIDGICECDEGYQGDPELQCYSPTPCGDCPHGATCIDAQCQCDPGFLAVSGGCEIAPVSDPATRSQSEVCAKWNEDRWSLTFDKWADEPQDQCDWGWLSEEYHLEAIRETTRYRWLVGLPAVTSSQGARESTQACATTLAAEGAGLTHSIPETYACYTTLAAGGAASSNLAGGAVSAADTVRRYILDANTPSLGHRRWIFSPRMGRTAFGIRDGYSCNYVFDSSGSSSSDFTAYPAPGYFPVDALHGKWSIASSSLSLTTTTEVLVKRLSDGAALSVTGFKYHSSDSYRPKMISWNIGSAPQAGESYEITIVGADSGTEDLVYETTLVDCGS